MIVQPKIPKPEVILHALRYWFTGRLYVDARGCFRWSSKAAIPNWAHAGRIATPFSKELRNWCLERGLKTPGTVWTRVALEHHLRSTIIASDHIEALRVYTANQLAIHNPLELQSIIKNFYRYIFPSTEIREQAITRIVQAALYYKLARD